MKYARAGLLGFLWCCMAVVPTFSQTYTYHLHKEASSTTGLDKLLTAGPDAATLALVSADLKGQLTGEKLIQAFDTQAGDPGMAGTIATGSTVSFSLYMRKTANIGTMTPRAKLFLNSATGTPFCTATGTTALTTTVTKLTFSCTTTAAITITASDRLYVWVGVNLTAGNSTTTFKGEVDVEGTINGSTDSQVTVPLSAPVIT